jgi:hypothetical protein
MDARLDFDGLRARRSDRSGGGEVVPAAEVAELLRVTTPVDVTRSRGEAENGG